MAITLSGQNNVDKITASDGVIDVISGVNHTGVVTATTFKGDFEGNITGNVTGNINNTTLLFQIGGAEKVRIASDGEVGIGTVNPNAPLDVFSNTAATDKDLFMVRSATGAFAVQCSNVSAANPEWRLRTYSSEPIVFSPGNVEKVRITGAGLVGIGSDAPTNSLDINAAAGVGIRLRNATTNNSVYFTSEASDKIQFNVGGGTGSYAWITAGTEKLTLTTAGNLGINTTVPAEKLSVAVPGSQRQNIAKFEHIGQQNFFIQGQWGSTDIGGANGTLLYGSATVALRAATSGPAHLVNLANGKIGIGTISPIGHLDVRDASGSDPTMSLHHSNADVEGEFIRVARTDIPTIRYHSIKAKHGGAAANNYITFNLHDTSSVTSQSEILRIVGNGCVNIGASTGNTTIHSSGLFNGVKPKFEVKLGGASNSYTRLINITNPGAQTGSETLGRVGIKLSLGSEASSGESNKSGIIYAESTSAYNNGPSLCFATNNGEKLRITSGGSVNLGTGELTQTARKLNVYGGAARVTQTSGGNTVEIMGNSTSGQSYGLLCSAGTTSGDINATFRTTDGTTRLRIRGDGNIGIANGSPFNRFCVGGHTFNGGNGMYANDRVGMSNHGNLTGLMLASTYNDANHPEYGLVFVQGPSTSSYNVWSISPDGPAKGNSLNLHYGAQNTNIHGPTNQKFEFTGEGYFLKPKHPSFLARRSTSGDGRAAASPITEWSTSTTAPCHNIGGHFNASNGKFTAPVAGMYHFSTCPGYKQSGNNYNVKFRIDSTDVFEPVRFIDGGDDLTSHSTATGSITVYMTANQTMSVCIAYTHHVNTTYNYFSGHLVG